MIRIDLKMVVFGFLTWFIPFGLAFLFYTPEGELAIDIFLFKTIMMLVGAVTGATLLVLYFKGIERNYLYKGVKVGLVWFALNISMDLVVLVPMSGMSIGSYFAEIGLRYLIIPTMSIAIGYVAEMK
ncbi:MAG: hypothetical protein EFT35_01280 [Methanophagales archaeon ANME-1-THS]|nr:MAG: hypothetical protein EFT35_01280 [Methanophagales archaeon ANME-1-THS]